MVRKTKRVQKNHKTKIGTKEGQTKKIYKNTKKEISKGSEYLVCKSRIMRNGKIVKKTLIFTLIATQVAIPLFSDVSYGWSYPLKQVTKLECKRTPWEDLKDECKQDLPRIANAQYAKHATNTQYTYIYSTLWGATYNN